MMGVLVYLVQFTKYCMIYSSFWKNWDRKWNAAKVTVGRYQSSFKWEVDNAEHVRPNSVEIIQWEQREDVAGMFVVILLFTRCITLFLSLDVATEVVSASATGWCQSFGQCGARACLRSDSKKFTTFFSHRTKTKNEKQKTHRAATAPIPVTQQKRDIIKSNFSRNKI